MHTVVPIQVNYKVFSIMPFTCVKFFLFFATSITEATIYSGFFLPKLNSDVGLENLVILKGWTLSQIMLESSDSLHKYTALSRTPCSNMYSALSRTSSTNILHWVGLLAQIYCIESDFLHKYFLLYKYALLALRAGPTVKKRGNYITIINDRGNT